MSVGIAKQESVDQAWMVRALESAGYSNLLKDEDGGLVTIPTETGCIHAGVDERRALLRLTAKIGDATCIPAGGPREAAPRLREVKGEMELARVCWYADVDALKLEYDLSLTAGLARRQFLTAVRAFSTDAATGRRIVQKDA